MLSTFCARARTARRSIARRVATGLAIGAALLVAGCSQSFLPAPTGQQTDLQAIGSGEVRVALLLPLSGDSAAIGAAMRNSAELALSELGAPAIRLVPLDTRGTLEGARQAAEQAVAGGASLIVGPVFAREVQAVGVVARQAQVPVIAFSSDRQVAGDGVYLLSFPPELDIARVVDYAAGQGKRAFASLVPEGPYGALAESAMRRAAENAGARVLIVERYGSGPGGMDTAIRRITAIAAGGNPRIDALLLPDGSSALRVLAPQLSRADVRPRYVQMLGSGQWNEPVAWSISDLQGAWFAGPPPGGWETFARKYQARYGTVPPRNATLAYDAVSLAAALARIGGAEAFSAQTLTNRDGFSGIDGVFRFRPNGTVDRALAVLEIEAGSARVREPAPSAFAAEE